MIVVVVGNQDDIDGGEVLKTDAGLPVPPGAGP